jgi:hypothetical protein
MKTISTREAHSYPPLFPFDLFGGDVLVSDPAPEATEESTFSETRQEVIERVYAEAEAEFIQMYRAFLLAYAKHVEDFIAGEITHEFEELHGKLSTVEGKQLGGLYQSLQRDGEIEKTGGYRVRNQGNPSPIYRLKK